MSLCYTYTHTGLLFIYILYQIAIEIYDADKAAGINSCFRYATKSNRYFYDIAFLETCRTFIVFPGGSKITNVLNFNVHNFCYRQY